MQTAPFWWERIALKKNNLSEEVESLKSDKSVEKIAREELGLTKPDEILIKGIEKWNLYIVYRI